MITDKLLALIRETDVQANILLSHKDRAVREFAVLVTSLIREFRILLSR